jgi:prohibitin 2
MTLKTRYFTEREELKPEAIVRDVVIAIVSAVLLIWLWPLRSVPTGSRGVITVGGAIRGIEGEGFTLIAPWQRLDIFNIRAEQADVKDADGATSDTQPVKTSLTVRYSISPDKVAEVFEKYSHDGNLDSYIHTATLETFKAVTARYTAPELIAKRPSVSGDISALLRTKVALYGAQIINIDMTNFAFGASYMAAINEKVTQEQLRLGADNKLKTVEAEQKQKVAIAEAEANALKAKADGEAYANLKLATAQADALKIQGSALAQNPAVLELRRVEVELAKAGRWNGALPTAIYAGAPIPFFNPTSAK